MGYDYTKNLKPVGQFDANACWAASISWWTAAMSLNYKRKWQTQSDLITKFNHLANEEDGTMPLSKIRQVCESAEIRAELKYISPSKLKNDYAIDMPVIIIFNYPKVGGTHMNVIFDQKDGTVNCMEPYAPFPGVNGQRSGKYVRRALSFFANSPEIGVGYLPLSDAFLQMQ